MAYDPKRPRPAASPDDEAPVDALLPSLDAEEPTQESVEPEPAQKSVEPAVTSQPAQKTDSVTPEIPSTEQSKGLPPHQASEVPVAAAPEEGTANRAVLLAVAAASLAAAVALIILSRRRATADKD